LLLFIYDIIPIGLLCDCTQNKNMLNVLAIFAPNTHLTSNHQAPKSSLAH